MTILTKKAKLAAFKSLKKQGYYYYNNEIVSETIEKLQNEIKQYETIDKHLDK